MNLDIFLDTDVIISALLTPKGVSADLLKNPQITKHLSNTSKQEALSVSQRKHLNSTQTHQIIDNCELTAISSTDIAKVSDYVNDPDDQHILAGAIKSGASFLATYNLKDFEIKRIHQDFGIIILIPGKLLQHLRSI